MRDLPTLTTDVVNRANHLSTKARDARRQVPGSPPAASIAPARVSNGVAVLRLYDYIDGDGGYWGISASEVAEALDDAGNITEIELRINSGGGAVWDGLAILNVLRSHDAKVTSVVDGVAASAASFIAVACDEVVMMPNSRMMIHDALGLCIGQATDMREYADFLDDTSDNIAQIYADRSGGSVEEWRATMTQGGLNGTWYGPQDAVDAGLADRVGGDADTDDPSTPAEDAPADRAPAGPSASDDAEYVERAMRRRLIETANRHDLKV